MRYFSGLGTFLETAPFGWQSSIDNVYLVFYSLIAIHRMKQHVKCLSVFAKLHEISYHNYILGDYIINACSNRCHCHYHSFA